MRRNMSTLREATKYFERLKKDSGSGVKLEYQNSIALITLSNPHKMNSMSVEMMLGLKHAVDSIERHKSTQALILYGKDNFCAGFDISRSEMLTPEGGKHMSVLMQDTLSRIHSLPVVSVAALEGYALGGGAELTTCADFRVVRDNVQWQLVHRKMGVTCGWGGVDRLVKLIGRKETLKLAGSMKRINAKHGLELGLFDKITSGDVVEASMDFLKEFVDDEDKLTPLSAVKQSVLLSDKGLDREEIEEGIVELFGQHFGSKRNADAIGRHHRRKSRL